MLHIRDARFLYERAGRPCFLFKWAIGPNNQDTSLHGECCVDEIYMGIGLREVATLAIHGWDGMVGQQSDMIGLARLTSITS
jgi:hypothetical protein